ncbi:flagellar assembly protein FliX [Salinarimonas ramus]|uniref:Flagellar assembly protein FliX n=1 Tax=Salinarimonas ramus TaxID=690164 RepID=A0A917Q6L0_9HYPH|nr:flagellar assembly protein FliX [Salinarimonas ramus]GGK30976.1 flagellar assembly protein FliX [Salinarimonas ramus]
MRIEGKPGVPMPSVSGSRRSSGSSGFSVDETPASASTARSSAVGPTTSLDAILALQGEEDPGERRRRAARRGQELLDGLDRLKAAILSGRVGPEDMKRIAERLTERRETSGDPRLDAILSQIELRAEVEMAKLAAREGRDGRI